MIKFTFLAIFSCLVLTFFSEDLKALSMGQPDKNSVWLLPADKIYLPQFVQFLKDGGMEEACGSRECVGIDHSGEVLDKIAQIGPQAVSALPVLMVFFKTSIGEIAPDAYSDYKNLNQWQNNFYQTKIMLKTFKGIGKGMQEVLPDLIKYVQSITPGFNDYRVEVLEIFEAVGPSAKQALPVIHKMLTDESDTVKNAALKALISVDPESTQTFKLVVASFKTRLMNGRPNTAENFIRHKKELDASEVEYVIDVLREIFNRDGENLEITESGFIKMACNIFIQNPGLAKSAIPLLQKMFDVHIQWSEGNLKDIQSALEALKGL